MTLEERWQAQLEALRRQGRERILYMPRGIDFSSNDYLGYGKLFWPHVEELSRSGQASRLLRGHHEIWDEVETRLARWHGAEAALMMTSGYVANEGLLSTIIEPGDWVASDQFNHASIVDGLRLSKAERYVYKHLDRTHFMEGLKAASAKEDRNRQYFLVSESLFSMEGTAFSTTALWDAVLTPFRAILDRAHATGCLGPTGAGMPQYALGVVATVHTGGKALGVPGAYICCSQLLKDYLINRCRHLIFTTALPPALGPWWLAAIERCMQDEQGRTRLRENVKLFRDELNRLGIQARGQHYIVPILVGPDADAVRAAAQLQAQGFDVRAIRPPTVPEGTARLRVSIHADHDRTTLLALAAAIARAVPAFDIVG